MNIEFLTQQYLDKSFDNFEKRFRKDINDDFEKKMRHILTEELPVILAQKFVTKGYVRMLVELAALNLNGSKTPRPLRDRGACASGHFNIQTTLGVVQGIAYII